MMFVQNCFSLVPILVRITFSADPGNEPAAAVQNHMYCNSHSNIFVAFASSCQVYPSEYAYLHDSVTRAESGSANCRRYPRGLPAPSGVFTDEYIHCDGSLLTLTNSDNVPEHYNSGDYYVWSGRSNGPLLFIFPMRVSMTTITLHYYSESDRGLPGLIFYAVPDDFGVWDTPTANTSHVDVAAVAPGGEPAGRRNVSITANYNAKKVLMYKISSIYKFAVSEVEFFKCKQLIILL